MNDWVKILRSGSKFYRIADLMKLSSLQYKSCRINVGRLVRKGFLIRLGKELYGNTFVSFSPEEACCRAYFPSYLSCEYALSRHGVLDQAPFEMTAVTLKRSKKTKVGKISVRYQHIRKNLFWGYAQDGDAWIAEPEKALLDWLYFKSESKKKPALDELNWEQLDTSQLRKYAKSFSKGVLRSLQPYLGKE